MSDKKCACGADPVVTCRECATQYCMKCQGGMQSNICDACCPWPIPKFRLQKGPTETLYLDLPDRTYKILDEMRRVMSLKAGVQITLDALIEDILTRQLDKIEKETKNE